jgi:trimethylamine:corrinoid methyltransferase-like protein
MQNHFHIQTSKCFTAFQEKGKKKKRIQNPKNYCSKSLSTASSSFTICSTNRSTGAEEA